MTILTPLFIAISYTSVYVWDEHSSLDNKGKESPEGVADEKNPPS